MAIAAHNLGSVSPDEMPEKGNRRFMSENKEISSSLTPMDMNMIKNRRLEQSASVDRD